MSSRSEKANQVEVDLGPDGIPVASYPSCPWARQNAKGKWSAVASIAGSVYFSHMDLWDDSCIKTR
jgi:hypothetical protein